MISYYERNYGADADGNRGVSFWEYELEKSDEPEILEQLETIKYEYYNQETQEFDLPDEVTITLYSCKSGEDVEFQINPKDYI